MKKSNIDDIKRKQMNMEYYKIMAMNSDDPILRKNIQFGLCEVVKC
ncbi:MAG: hypothetical protein SPL99_10150 [Catonella sp.]|nr:hypothetical protein [Catonella sp.]MDY6355977.1 hypothetical protein [Catonella sp.]